MLTTFNTPIATPSVSAVPEPLSVLLEKPIDLSEKIKQVSNAIHSRIFSDAIVEHLPGLFLLLREASEGCVTEEAAKTIFGLFSIQSENCILRLISQSPSTFVFPIASLPASIDWSAEFEFFEHLSHSSILSNRKLNLTAVDYFFFAIAVLPLVPQPSHTWGSWSSSSYHRVALYDAKRNGSIQERILLEVFEWGISAKSSSLSQKTVLTIAVLQDLYLNLFLYSYNNSGLNFSSIFGLLNSMFGISAKHGALEATRPHTNKSIPVLLAERYGSLLSKLLDSDNCYSLKFLHRIDPLTVRELSRCWVNYCHPWKAEGPVSRSTKDSWIRKNSRVYSLYSTLLSMSPVQDFVRDFQACSHSETRLAGFIDLSDTRNLVEALVDIMSIAAPDTGMAEAIPEVFLSDRCIELTRFMWSVCVACTWLNSKVPRNMSDASWVMDKIVNACKSVDDERLNKSWNLYEIFTWNVVATPATTEGETETGIPKTVSKCVLSKRLSAIQPRRVSCFTWDQPITSVEYAFVLWFLKRAILVVTKVDVQQHPDRFAWIRELGSVSVLLPLCFLFWLFTSISVCPSLHSGSTIFVIQLVFALVVGLMAIKWIGSQYIV
jgi:hypothetical protein